MLHLALFFNRYSIEKIQQKHYNFNQQDIIICTIDSFNNDFIIFRINSELSGRFLRFLEDLRVSRTIRRAAGCNFGIRKVLRLSARQYADSCQQFNADKESKLLEYFVRGIFERVGRNSIEISTLQRRVVASSCRRVFESVLEIKGWLNLRKEALGISPHFKYLDIIYSTVSTTV